MHADALLVIGHDIIEKPPFVSTQEGCKVIHMNTHSAARDVVYNSTSEVVGELAHTLKEFSQNIKPNPEWDFTHFFKVRDVLQQDIQVYRESPDFPLRPERIVGDLENVLPDDGTLALDNGMYKIWISRNFKAKNSRSLLLDNAFATMGAGLPSGIALKVLYPEKKVIAVVGDGGLMMSLGDLETAVRLGVNLVVLVLDDSEYGMIRWKQKAMDLPLFGLTFGNPDFVKLAESFGATGHKVSSADDLLPRLERALSSTGVHIISCPVNYQEANTFLADVKNKASDL
jgi:acetolactate synthase-1/2/3 large subunit